MPNPFELPRMRGAVVPLVGAGCAFVRELVVDRFPGLSTVVGALNELAKPAGALRRIQAIGIDGGAFEVINLPASEMRTAHVPLFTLSIRCEHERALACADENPHAAHLSPLSQLQIAN